MERGLAALRACGVLACSGLNRCEVGAWDPIQSRPSFAGFDKPAPTSVIFSGSTGQGRGGSCRVAVDPAFGQRRQLAINVLLLIQAQLEEVNDFHVAQLVPLDGLSMA